MKKIFLAMTAAAAMLAACNNSGVSYNITLTAPEDLGDLRLVCDGGEVGKSAFKFDAATNTYTLKGHSDEVDAAAIVDHNDAIVSSLFLEKGNILVQYDEASDSFIASGTKSNDAMNEYQPQLLAFMTELDLNPVLSDEEKEALFDRFYNMVFEIIDLNSDNLYGATLLAGSGTMLLEPAEILDYIDKFPKELQDSKILAPVKSHAEAQLKTAVGSPYIEITAPDVDGNDIALSSVVGEGKWVLVDFWATWCGPCCGELPYLKAAYEKYADKGFEIYGVSLNNDAEAWKEFLPQNGMNWINVIGIRSDKSSPAADDYGINTIPANFLIAPDGRIAAKDLRGEAVEAKLAEIFE